MSGVNRQPGRPRYQAIAEELREKIARGEYGPGDQLPTKAQMMEQWGVALNTVARAVEVLQYDGLVETFHGVGTFVRTPSAEPDEESGGYAEEIERLRARVDALEAQMMDVFSNLGLQYSAADVEPNNTKRAV